MQRVFEVVVGGLFLLLFCWVAAQPVHHSEQPKAPVTVCQEDDPCWDCATMGNLICGPTQANG